MACIGTVTKICTVSSDYGIGYGGVDVDGSKEPSSRRRRRRQWEDEEEEEEW